MKPSSTLRNAVGLLALVASLLLASPGVHVVRAEANAEASCSTDEVAQQGPRDATVEERLRRENQARNVRLPARSDGDFVVLNTNGYNYGPQRGAGPAPAPAPVQEPQR